MALVSCIGNMIPNTVFYGLIHVWQFKLISKFVIVQSKHSRLRILTECVHRYRSSCVELNRS